MEKEADNTVGKPDKYGVVNADRREAHRTSGGRSTGGNHSKPVVVVDWEAAIKRFQKMMKKMYR